MAKDQITIGDSTEHTPVFSKPLLLTALSVGLLSIGVLVLSLFLLGESTGYFASGGQIRPTGYSNSEWLWLLYSSSAGFVAAVALMVLSSSSRR